MYIWRYEAGYVVDPETGEVIDLIYDYGPYEGNNEPSLIIGTSSYEDKIAEKASRIQRTLNARGLRDAHGTYVNYLLGLTNKSVKSLKRIETKERLPLTDKEYEKEVRRWLVKIEKNLRTMVLTSKTKKAIACILAARSLDRELSVSEVARFYEIDEKYLRKVLSRVTKRLLPYMLR
ncbi:hypothetical protein EYM_07290 [Ignicoccus islandicus DSM 13165]|uniref:Uncharacterized protein n=1 Tax=Ignicoccus islandicus DSM 13165 TaxID=940295 RepID=A0A0U2MBR5_9CREN|nr:hypothetical protein [Ignicoccus islandicus]ALU12765.1 hypothetical protein EYM_07290 [Ignicoccus islandicus DSM 13165]